jgi:hypothetical protein
MFKMSALCCETCPNSFKHISGNLSQFTFAEFCKLLHKYFILEFPSHVDFWHTQHFSLFRTNKHQRDYTRGSRGPQTLANNSIISIYFAKQTA